MRFYLVDKITEMNPGKTAGGIKCWSLDNEIFQDHFPGVPMVPGVLLIESMAQLAGFLIKHSYYKEYGEVSPVYPILSIVQKAKFRSFVRPGDQCFLRAELLSVERQRGNAKVFTTVDNNDISEATLSFMIGSEEDLGYNPYIKKMDQFYHSITR